MARKVGTIVCTIVLVLALAGTALAGKRVALVIGNSAYTHVTRLPNPANDAHDMAAKLEALGFDVRQATDLGRIEMSQVLADFSDLAVDADIALVFFAGHGLELDRVNYLVPVDARLEVDRRVRFEAISLDDVEAALEAVRGIRIILLDACRNNPFAASMRMSSASRSVSRGLRRVEAANGSLISFAAKEGTVADDGAGRNSPFTAALLANLGEPGVEISLLFRRVRDSVLAATNNRQEPYVSASLPSDPIYLVPSGAAATPGPAVPPSASPSEPPPSASQTSPEERIVRDYELTAGIGTRQAWEAFLARHGSADSLYVDLARAALDQLEAAASPAPAPAPSAPDGGDIVTHTFVANETDCRRACARDRRCNSYFYVTATKRCEFSGGWAGTSASSDSRVATETHSVEVPNVVGMTFDQAKKNLTSEQLNVALLHRSRADGYVLSQTPDAGTHMPIGSTIRLNVGINPNISDSSLIAYYPFNGTSNDETGIGRSFAFTNVEFVENAVYLNGGSYGTSDGYEAIAQLSDFDYNEFSVSLDFKPTGQNDHIKPIIMGGTSYRWFGIMWNENRQLQIVLNNWNYSHVFNDTDITPGSWHNIICSVDINRKAILTMLDGKLLEKITLPSAFRFEVVGSSAEQSDKNITFANYSNTATYQGYADELRVFREAKSVAEMERLFSLSDRIASRESGVGEAAGRLRPDTNQGLVLESPEVITEVQQLLERAGFEPGPIDGKMGSRTRSAILAFQRRQSLEPTGEITEALRQALQSAPAAAEPAMKRFDSPTIDGMRLDSRPEAGAGFDLPGVGDRYCRRQGYASMYDYRVADSARTVAIGDGSVFNNNPNSNTTYRFIVCRR